MYWKYVKFFWNHDLAVMMDFEFKPKDLQELMIFSIMGMMNNNMTHYAILGKTSRSVGESQINLWSDQQPGKFLAFATIQLQEPQSVTLRASDIMISLIFSIMKRGNYMQEGC